MTKMRNILLAASLLGAGTLAFAAQQQQPSEPEPVAHHEGKPQHHRQGHPMPPHCPMMMAPAYQASMQTSDPNEALKKMTNDVPTLEKGKRYQVSVTVKELPPLPPAPNKPEPKKAAE